MNSNDASPRIVAQDHPHSSASLTRRGFLGSSIALAGAAGAGLLNPSETSADDKVKASPSGRRIIASDTEPVVETQYGKIRGSIRDGIYTFKGVPYGADTGGPNRWKMAKKPTPWAGIKGTTCFTYTCPTSYRAAWGHDDERFIYDFNDGIPGEAVLNLSLWTQGINDNKKRPVLVWIHGGGYSSGSNEELKYYDGARLAKRGDIIVVGLNHRLNILGFLNLEKFGDEYKNSPNVSQLDLVAGLEWIRDNIANFGGDPNRVTIFGQSGGGGKVTYLMGMPAARGLFHRAAMESASQPRPYTEEQSAAYSDRVLKILGVNSAADLGKIHDMPYAGLLAAMQEANRRDSPPPTTPAATPAIRTLRRQAGLPGGFQPSTGSVIPELPFYPNSLDMSAHIPVITGGVLNEFSNGMYDATVEDLTKDQILALINKDLPGKAEALYSAFEKLKLPGRGVPFDYYSQMVGITSFRANAVQICKVRAAAAGHAPAYNYQVRWQTPTLDGRPRAFHCSGLQFAFDNIDLALNATGGGPDAHALAAVMSEALIAFVKTGNPNHPGMPAWDRVMPDKVTTMVFDNKVEQVGNFDKEEIDMLTS